MVFSDEEEAKLLGCLHAGVVKSGSSPSGGDLKSKGYGFATIKPTLTPIHTYNGTTPGDPEKPIPDVTDGECSIYKLYYTQKYDKKGNLLEEKVDSGVHLQHKTTNYIVIDAEKGYVVENWFIQVGLYFI